jgi:hypothetical protein
MQNMNLTPLQSFIDVISITPDLQKDVRKCSSTSEICEIALRYNLNIDPQMLKHLKPDLAAPYWPWTNLNKISL